MTTRMPLVSGLALALCAASAQAQTQSQAPRPDQGPGELCRAAEYRQLDYSIGRFRVVAETGEPAGDLQVEAILAGCALRARWRGAIAGSGEATTWYDRHTGQWHRVFVNDDGNSFRLSGRVGAAGLVLSGRSAFFDGRIGLQRLTWVPQPDGSIRQHWELSMDDGRSWETLLASRAIPERP